MKKKLSEKDRKDWEKFINNDEKIKDKDIELNNIKEIKSKTLDLHGYTLENANQLVKNFILNSYSQGIKELTVITGKGLRSKNIEDPYKSKDLSILKYSIPEFIKSDEEIMSKIFKINLIDIDSLNKGSFKIILKNIK
mgnify:FL=1